MLSHVSLVCHAESVTNDTVTTRDFNKVILQHVESGVLDWSPNTAHTYDQLKVNFLAGLRPGNPKLAGQQTRNQQDYGKSDRSYRARKQRAAAICGQEYGDGTCKEQGDHGKDKEHICYHCMVQYEKKATH